MNLDMQLLERGREFIKTCSLSTLDDRRVAFTVMRLSECLYEYRRNRLKLNRKLIKFILHLFSFSQEEQENKVDAAIKHFSIILSEINYVVPSHQLITDFRNNLESKVIGIKNENGQYVVYNLILDKRPLTKYEKLMYAVFNIVPSKWC